MANMVKWLTHLAVNQARVGSIPTIRPKKVLYNSLDLAINRRVFTLIEHILHEPVQLD